jgi:hypothetical protein
LNGFCEACQKEDRFERGVGRKCCLVFRIEQGSEERVRTSLLKVIAKMRTGLLLSLSLLSK